MLSIHPKVQRFVGEDEMNYEADEINKENKNEFWIFIADQKSENTKHTTKYDKQILCKFWSKEERVERSKRRTFSLFKTNAKKKYGVAYKPSTLTYFQRTIQRDLNPKGYIGELAKKRF